jgi:hypothetical protein
MEMPDRYAVKRDATLTGKATTVTHLKRVVVSRSSNGNMYARVQAYHESESQSQEAIKQCQACHAGAADGPIGRVDRARGCDNRRRSENVLNHACYNVLLESTAQLAGKRGMCA